MFNANWISKSNYFPFDAKLMECKFSFSHSFWMTLKAISTSMVSYSIQYRENIYTNNECVNKSRLFRINKHDMSEINKTMQEKLFHIFSCLLVPSSKRHKSIMRISLYVIQKNLFGMDKQNKCIKHTLTDTHSYTQTNDWWCAEMYLKVDLILEYPNPICTYAFMKCIC